jgi:hypothetical protein
MYYPGNCLEGLRENHKHFCQVSRYPDEIRSGVLSDTSHKRYCLTRHRRCTHVKTRIIYVYRVYDRSLWREILVEEPLAFMEPESLLPCSQQLDTAPYSTHDLTPHSLTTLPHITL